MKRHDYIKQQATELKKLCDRRQKFSDRYTSGNLSQKQTQKIDAELNWIGMYISQTEERLAFALGYLRPEEAREEYRPSGFHTYKGIESELKQIKFEM